MQGWVGKMKARMPMRAWLLLLWNGKGNVIWLLFFNDVATTDWYFFGVRG